MKKMVCEICGSQSIRKEKGVFICQECGTEYSIEEAKKLLKEISNDVKIVEISNEKTENELVRNNENKYVLLRNLRDWLILVSSFEDVYFWIGNFAKIENLCDENNLCLMKDSINNSIKVNFPVLNTDVLAEIISDKISDSQNRLFNQFYSGDDNIKETIFSNPVISNAYKLFKEYADEQCLVNGKYYYKYMFFLNWNYERGIPFKNLYNYPNNWFLLVKDQKNGTRFVAADTQVHKGIFGDRVSNNILLTLDATNFITTLDELSKQLIERHTCLEKFYLEHFDEMKQCFIELMEQMDKMIMAFDLPVKYRNIKDILLLIKYIRDGRVDNWKEAVNLLELEKYQENLLLKLENINITISNLNSIIENGLSMTNEQLSNISTELMSLNSKMNENIYALRKIMNYERLNLIFK